MALRDKERYYWLKLDRGFFKRHDIAIIEDMPNGKDYVLFYLKLMLESVDHEGALRFSDTIPYNEQMLASVTKTNVDIVRSALRLFEELGMVEVFDDKTLFMTEAAKLLGRETYAAKRKRIQRHPEMAGDNVPRLSPECPQEIDIEKEIEKDTEKELSQHHPRARENAIQDPALAKVMGFYMEEIARNVPSTTVTTDIQCFVSEMGDDIVLHAMERAAEADKHDWRYVKGILNRYKTSGLDTLEKVLLEEKRFQAGKSKSGTADEYTGDITAGWDLIYGKGAENG